MENKVIVQAAREIEYCKRCNKLLTNQNNAFNPEYPGYCLGCDPWAEWKVSPRPHPRPLSEGERGD